MLGTHMMTMQARHATSGEAITHGKQTTQQHRNNNSNDTVHAGEEAQQEEKKQEQTKENSMLSSDAWVLCQRSTYMAS